jgi:hypothetical protein
MSDNDKTVLLATGRIKLVSVPSWPIGLDTQFPAVLVEKAVCSLGATSQDVSRHKITMESVACFSTHTVLCYHSCLLRLVRSPNEAMLGGGLRAML